MKKEPALGESTVETTTVPAARPVVLGYIDLSFHRVAAAIVAHLLTTHGQAVTLRTAPHEELFEQLKRGEIDMLCSAWLPGSHNKYFLPLQNELVKLGVLYEPYAFWGVPDYVPVEAVASVADLTALAVAERMTKLIQGIGPGAGISRFSREIFAHYNLEHLGYRFENGTQQQCEDAFTTAMAAQRWVVVPLWQPQHLTHNYAIRELREPLGLLQGQDEATLVIRKDRQHLLEPRLLATLHRLALGNAHVTYLDYLLNQEKLTPEAAAARWFSENPMVVQHWLI